MPSFAKRSSARTSVRSRSSLQMTSLTPSADSDAS
jgi:hypothetical protein